MNGSLFIRIDDRLIHGQIVTAWAKILNIKKIIALDDALAVSEMLAEIMLMGISDAYEPEILTTSAVESFLSHHPRDGNVLLVTRAAENLALLQEQLSLVSAVNIGNYFSEKDVEVLDDLSSKGIKTVFQQMPTDKEVQWQQIKEGLKRIE